MNFCKKHAVNIRECYIFVRKIVRRKIILPNLGNNKLCPYQESNLDLPLRRQPFYPLNYKDFGSLG